MFFIIVITLIAISILLLIFHIFRKLCQDPVPPPAYRSPQGPPPPYRDPRSSSPPPLTLMPSLPSLPSLPSGAVPVGLEPPPYSEVTAKPFLYPPPQGPCPKCGHDPTAQPPSSSCA